MLNFFKKPKFKNHFKEKNLTSEDFLTIFKLICLTLFEKYVNHLMLRKTKTDSRIYKLIRFF